MSVTQMKQISAKEFLLRFELETYQSIAEAIRQFSATGVVCFENLQMDSSHFGDRTAMVVGPDCTFKSLEEVWPRHLNDVPSRRQYPTAWVDAKELQTEIRARKT